MSEQGPTRIMIAERQAAVRLAIEMFLQTQPGLEVVGEAADAQELAAQIEAIHPDIILLDWGLSARPSADLVQTLREIDHQPSVIVMDVQPESKEAALAAGSDAFVCKAEPPQQLLAAIRAVRLARSDWR